MEHIFHPKRCSSSRSTFAETVANIDELLIEILVRVPAKPLVRFKCVSKHWLSIISDPKFCHRHTLCNPNTPVSAVFPDTSTQWGFIPLPLDDHQSSVSDPLCNPLNLFQHEYDLDPIKVIQSCNGLFLCQLLDLGEGNPPFFILNPTTNQFITLIPPVTAVTNDADKQVEPSIISIALAFDPSKSPHYKVVCLIDKNKGWTRFHILIYSSETQIWRLLDSSFSMDYQINYDEGVFCNGAIHWVGSQCQLSYFHVDEERIGVVLSPPNSIEKRSFFLRMGIEKRSDDRVYRYFQESGDRRHLHLIDIYRHHLSQFEVLEMGKDYSGWFVKYFVDLEPISTVDPWFRVDSYMILFLSQEENEGEECSSLLLHTPGKAFSYNLKSKTAKSFDLAPMTNLDDSYLRVDYQNYRYIESLACV